LLIRDERNLVSGFGKIQIPGFTNRSTQHSIFVSLMNILINLAIVITWNIRK